MQDTVVLTEIMVATTLILELPVGQSCIASDDDDFKSRDFARGLRALLGFGEIHFSATFDVTLTTYDTADVTVHICARGGMQTRMFRIVGVEKIPHHFGEWKCHITAIRSRENYGVDLMFTPA